RVRMMVVDRASGAVAHTSFDWLADHLRSGDLLVFNSSRTIPASLKGGTTACGASVGLPLPEHLPDDTWLALALCEGTGPFACGVRTGLEIVFRTGLAANVLGQDASNRRLWRVRFSETGASFMERIHRIGEPIRYEYVAAPWVLDDYQTVYACE